MPQAQVGGAYNSFITVFLTTTMGGVYGVRGNNSLKFGGTYQSYKVVIAQVGGSYSSRAVRIALQGGRYRNFIQEKRKLYARNVATDVVTELGELLPGQTTLIDVALADGVYEVDVRSDKHYWQDTRSRKRFTLEIDGGVIANQGVPNIQTLSISINSSFQRVLSWTIPDVQFDASTKFGVWRSASSPVDVSGAPDFTVNAFEGVGVYSQVINQTADEYYAVAAFDDTDQGPESEIFAPWDLNPDPSPNQYGYSQ